MKHTLLVALLDGCIFAAGVGLVAGWVCIEFGWVLGIGIFLVLIGLCLFLEHSLMLKEG